MKRKALILFSILCLNMFAIAQIGQTSDIDERIMIIGRIAERDWWPMTRSGFIKDHREYFDLEENETFLITDYFGWFRIKLPDDITVEEASSYESAKVTLDKPRMKSQHAEIDISPPVNVLAVKRLHEILGILINETEGYIDIEIRFINRNNERRGEIQRVLLADTQFALPRDVGELVIINFSIDDRGGYVAELVVGSVNAN